MAYPLGGLRYAVGPNMPNDPFDCNTVRFWLTRWKMPQGWAFISGSVLFDWRLRQAIYDFQGSIMNMGLPSGVIHPGDSTELRLAAGPAAGLSTSIPKRPPVGPLPLNPLSNTPMRLPARTGFKSLDAADYKAAGSTLGCEPEVIEAFAKVEGRGHGFDKYDRPVILYEPKHFATLSRQKKAYETAYPSLTHLGHKPHLYGSDDEQWRHLQQAYLLIPHAALQASSWGKFQQVGEFCKDAGYSTVEAMVTAMCQSEQIHLSAFVTRIQNTGLAPALAKKDWVALAIGYNGSGYKQFSYDTKLKDAYEALKASNAR